MDVQVEQIHTGAWGSALEARQAALAARPITLGDLHEGPPVKETGSPQLAAINPTLFTPRGSQHAKTEISVS